MKTEFGKRLGKLRQEEKLSQRQAAAQLGISQALLSHYENGAREPGLEFVLSACKFYAVTADFLLGRTDESKSGATILSGKVREIVTLLEEVREVEATLLGELTALVSDEETP